MSASSLFLSPSDARIDTRYVSPLSAPLNTNGFPITNASSVSASEILTEQIALPTGSLQTKIAIGDSIEVAGSIKATAIPAAGSAYPNVLGYNTATGAIEYQAAGGGGGGNAYGTFTYSATAPHPVDSWYNNTATNIAFSNNGSAANQSWLGALQAATQSLATVYIQVVQGSLVQSLKVVSVTPAVGFTYVEYITATIPPMWVDGAATNFYYTLEQSAPLAYANFYSTQTQTLAAGGTPITLNTTAEATDITRSGADIVVTSAGTYSITFSAQIVGGANEQACIYFTRNGSTIADSASYVEVKNNEAQIMTINFIATLGAGDTLNIVGQSASGLSTVEYIAAVGSNPASPSIIVTIYNLSAAVGGGSLTNPLTADLNANGYNIQNASTVQTNIIALPTSGANPSIDVTAPIVFTDPTIPAQFTLPPQTAVAPTVGNDLVNKTYVDSLTTSLAGLYNTLRIVPTATGQTVAAQTFTSLSSPYSSWIPDATPNTLINPVAGTGNSWRLTKSPGGAGTRWWVWPYNPQWNLSPPFTAPSVTFNKTNLNALYALIRIKNANIATQGAFFFNIYTYDYTAAPTQAYSSRFDYSLNNLALPLTTGALALQTEFVYLVYACDAPKIVATPPVSTTIAQANGQTPGQQTSQMLRDPFDIHTTVPHIPMSAVAVTNGATVPSDINQVPVLSLVFGCTSSAITNGVDMEVLSVGYKANGGAINVEYSLQYS